MTGPDDARVHGPGIFERGVLRHGHAAPDSVVIEAVAQGQRSRKVAPAPAVAAADAIPVVDLVVYLNVELVIRRGRRRGVVIVVELVRVAGLRVKIEHGHADGVLLAHRDNIQLSARRTVGLHLRPAHAGGRWRANNQRLKWVVDVLRHSSSGIRICREVAHPLSRSWYSDDAALRAEAPDLLEINKKERAVLLDRPAQGKAALVALAVWLGVGRRVQEIAGVDPWALQEIPAAAMELVASALHDHVDHGAAVVAELRREAVVLDFHFLHALDQRLVVNVGVSSLSLFGCADQSTIHPHLGG